MSWLAKGALFVCAAGAIVRAPEDYALQPSYFVIAILPLTLLLVLGLKGHLSRPTGHAFLALGCMFSFFLIDLGHFVAGGFRGEQISSTIFWPLAVLYVLALSTDSAREYLKTYVRYIGVWLTLSLLVALVQFATNFPTRATGLSGTPNHLALQIVHFFMLIIVCGIKVKFGIQRLLGVLSLSRAYIAFLALSFFSKKARANPAVLALLVIAAGVLVQQYSAGNLLAENEQFLLSRFNFFENSSDEEGRGMLRVARHPEYLFYGAGELRVSFPDDPFVGQIHNNFVALAYCFGIAGAAFSIWCLATLSARAGIYNCGLYILFSLGAFFFNNIMFLTLVAALASSRVVRVEDE